MVVPNEEPKKPTKPKKPAKPRKSRERSLPVPVPASAAASKSSTRTRPESMCIPTCIWSASPPTVTPTQFGSSAPTPPIFRRSSRG